LIESKVLKQLHSGNPVLCVSTAFKDPNIVELIGSIGFDCLWIDNEHCLYDSESISEMIRACRLTGMDAMIRIEKNYTSLIKPLEMGAKGIMIPHIKTVEEAEFWIKAARFYPEGSRSVNAAFADSDWGSMDFKEYIKFSNKETFLIFQIEDAEAIVNIEEMMKLTNPDIFFIGVMDLCCSMGLEGDMDNIKIWEILEKVGKLAKKYGKIIGTTLGSKERNDRIIDMGYLFLCDGTDFAFIRESFTDLKESYKKRGFTFLNEK
jgi:4-hydroxy-2-oxoheptanedioate aldolase